MRGLLHMMKVKEMCRENVNSFHQFPSLPTGFHTYSQVSMPTHGFLAPLTGSLSLTGFHAYSRVPIAPLMGSHGFWLINSLLLLILVPLSYHCSGPRNVSRVREVIYGGYPAFDCPRMYIHVLYMTLCINQPCNMVPRPSHHLRLNCLPSAIQRKRPGIFST